MTTTILTTTALLVFHTDAEFRRDDKGHAYIYDDGQTLASIDASEFVAHIEGAVASSDSGHRERYEVQT